MIENLHPVLACPPPQARAVPRLRHCPLHWKRWSCAVTDRKGSKRSVHPFESGGPRSLDQLPLVRVWSQCPRSGHNILVSLSGNGSPHPHPGVATSAAASSPSAQSLGDDASCSSELCRPCRYASLHGQLDVCVLGELVT